MKEFRRGLTKEDLWPLGGITAWGQNHKRKCKFVQNREWYAAAVHQGKDLSLREMAEEMFATIGCLIYSMLVAFLM